jgi:hypothetical protein
MRREWPDEVAQLVVEDNSDARAIIKLVHQLLRNPRNAAGLSNDLIEVLPLTKTRGSPHFATKAEAYCLQVADICAFIIRGHLTKHKHSEPLYRAIRPMILEPLDLEYLTSGPVFSVSSPYRPARKAGSLWLITPPWSGNSKALP